MPPRDLFTNWQALRYPTPQLPQIQNTGMPAGGGFPDMTRLFGQLAMLHAAMSPGTMPGPETFYHPEWFNPLATIHSDPTKLSG